MYNVGVIGLGWIAEGYGSPEDPNSYCHVGGILPSDRVRLAAVADPLPLLRDIETGMAAGPNVRGALIGRNVLFPGQRDPLQMARAVSRIVH